VASKAICRLWHEASNDERLWRSFKCINVSTDLRNSWGDIKKVVHVLDAEHKAQTEVNDDTAWIMLHAERELAR
jgi:hypothetical protein